ncbi:hypothetical protein BSZ19_45300 [Bradyrhizobium japonicum]|uniref:Uncharacterized protein n=1 Tax=Bradyrhizobium japonicum TaxID=375 RepID=A0A1Y2J8W3_BRAJP|nr:hypothetical protein BSZ19_45300 [Bradyrhizobium japonicum]
MTKVPPPSLRGALATKQSGLPPRKDSGLLRYARNDGMSGALSPTTATPPVVRSASRRDPSSPDWRSRSAQASSLCCHP